MTTPKRRYIDELMDGIRFSSGGPVSISLETAKRLEILYKEADYEVSFSDSHLGELTRAIDALDEEMPEPPDRIDQEVEAMPQWQRDLSPTLRPDYVVPPLEDEMPEPKP